MLHYDLYACNKADVEDVIGSMDGSFPMAFIGRYQSIDDCIERSMRVDNGLLATVIDIVGTLPDEPEDDDDFEF